MHIVGIGLVCVNLFAAASNLAWSWVPHPRRWVARLASREDRRPQWLLEWAGLLLAVGAWVPTVIAWGGDVSAAIAGLQAMRSTDGPGPSTDPGLLQHLYLLGLCAGAASLARISLRRQHSLLVNMATVGLMLPLAALGASSRFNFGFLLLPAMLVLIVRGSSGPHWHRDRKWLLAIGCAGALALLIQGSSRNSGLSTWIDDVAGTGKVVKGLNAGAFGHEHFGAMLMAIDLVTDRNPLFMEPMTPFFATHFVPRSVWPDKPYPKSWTYYNGTVTAGNAFNVTPSITGQYYMNWGFAGVLWIGLFMGWVARVSEDWLYSLRIEDQMASATVGGLLLAFVFLSFRFFYPLYFAYPLFGYILYLALSTRPRTTYASGSLGPSASAE